MSFILARKVQYLSLALNKLTIGLCIRREVSQLTVRVDLAQFTDVGITVAVDEFDIALVRLVDALRARFT